MSKILYKDEVYAIQGAVFEVYREFYDYDRTPLNAALESSDTDSTP